MSNGNGQLVMFEAPAATRDVPIKEAWLDTPPRVGDSLIFDGDDRVNGEPCEYRVTGIRWVITPTGAEVVVRLDT